MYAYTQINDYFFSLSQRFCCKELKIKNVFPLEQVVHCFCHEIIVLEIKSSLVVIPSSLFVLVENELARGYRVVSMIRRVRCEGRVLRGL